MIPDQTKKKVEEFVEGEKIIYCPVSPGMFENAIHRAIRFGLELAKEAGPESFGWAVERRPETRETTLGDSAKEVGFDTALTAKNAAIQSLIDAVKK